MKLPIFAAVALAASAPALAQPGLYFINDFNPTLYRLSTVNGAATIVGPSGVIPSTGFSLGLTETSVAGELLGSIPDFGLNYIQTDGSGFSPASTVITQALAYDAASDIFYGASNGSFFSLDPVTSTTISLPAAPGNADIDGLAARNGIIYGLVGFFGPNPGDLYAYNPGTTLWSFVGDTGIDFEAAGLAYNPFDGLLYAKGSQDTLLYSISPFTAATNVVGDTGIQFGGGLGYVVPTPSALGLLALSAVSLSRRRR